MNVNVVTKKLARFIADIDHKECAREPLGAVRQAAARLLSWCRSPDGIGCLVLLAIALVARLRFAPTLMVTGDMLSYEHWGEEVNANFWHVYSAYATQTVTKSSWFTIPVYPPVALYLYGLITKVYFGVGAALGLSLSHNVLTSPGLKVALKLPGIISDEIFLAVIYVKGLQRLSRGFVWLAALTYALSPGILMTVVLWGQVDGIIAMLGLLGLLAALHDRPVWAGVLFALAVNLKPQPIVFVPVVLVYLLRAHGVRAALRGAIAFVGMSVLVWLPYLLPPNFEVVAFVHNVNQANAFAGITASRGAGNLWYLLNLGTQPAGVPVLGPLSLNQVGEALLGLIVLIVLLVLWFDTREELLWAGAALTAYAFFTVMTLQYERYLYPALGLFFVAALCNRSYWILYAVTTATFFLNYELTLYLITGVAAPPVGGPAHPLSLVLWWLGLVNCSGLLLGIAIYLVTWRRRSAWDVSGATKPAEMRLTTSAR